MSTLTTDAMHARSQLRRQLRQQRQQLSTAARQANSAAICHHLLAALWFRRARRIGCYLATDGEPDLQPLLPLLAPDTATWLPVIDTLTAQALRFRRWSAGMPLTRNRFGIGEPAAADSTPLWSLDILLLPLVGFDRHGQRLGRGGGFYDRALADLARRPQRPILVGVAHDFQECDSLPAAPWDVPLDRVVTNRGVLLIRA